jgi:hypothetical protein
MADYGRDAHTPSPTYYEYDLKLARREGRVEGFDSGFEAALIAVARKRKKTDNAPLRCPLCERLMYEELHHECPSESSEV